MGALPANIPSAHGTYVVLLRLNINRTITVGKLGRLDFKPGWYAYVGSAMGSGGLAARIGRHNRCIKKKHWHIDYLRPDTRIEGLCLVADPLRREHRWAQYLGKAPLSGEPIHGFGSTDCRCVAHLYHFATCPDPALMASTLEAQWIPLTMGSRNR